MRFIYVLTGWEGSTADSRVLRDAIHRTNRLHVPRGTYYLCDNGYPNCDGFLTPYKCVRYHLSEWTSRLPQTYQEYFNMKHTRVRNVIEHTFGLLKMRWGILRGPSWYPIKTSNKIIMACCLLHNYIRGKMDVNPLEGGLDEYMSTQMNEDLVNSVDVVDMLETSTQWNTWRDTIAQNIMDAHGSGNAANGGKGKSTRGRRSWSNVEEDALIHCLLEIVNDGWKAENGFKAGFQRELERSMRKMLPGTDILATPHINSKIHVWKKEYGVISDLLSKSGMGWNSTTSMIEVGDEAVWDASRRADPHLKSVRYKSWPYYSQWLEIFGKDRATGENTELLRVDLEQEGDNGEKNIPRFKDKVNEIDDNSICKPYNSGMRNGSKGKKCKSGDVDLSKLVDSLGDFMQFSKEAMTKDACVGTKVETDKESGSKHEQSRLIESLKGINGLKVCDKLKVCDELVQNTMNLEFFLSLPTDEQEEYVWMLLDGRI
ncbi:hypothetical protein ACS0TY_018452 [Phlomoides rotata]